VVSDFGADYTDIVDSQLAGSFESTQVDRGFNDDVLSLTPFNAGFEDIEAKATELIADMKFPAGSKCADAA
jgi:hypothetical protein